ncbi:hypothetical protein PMAYCL1PPCAC_23683 [Pristionchus mayeri]|uniref:C2H2-type domain-containing protein n=1 Tax=Pristionchus mayeri TaxID=1317129 RepID=A0AAN5I5Y3_9BILA|nr:hypothetical protein PMAYCL1PPCAC_23683 [Pristionchus mayeri]
MEEEEEDTSPMPILVSNSAPSANASRVQTTINGRYTCTVCPFKTRDNERLERHNYGHSRAVGFLCPLCTFKSESAGFLKRHVEIHGVREYPWPPVYVGISPRMNGIMEKSEREGSPTLIPIGKVLKAAHHASIPRDKIGECVSALQTGQSPSLLQLRSAPSSSLMKTAKTGEGMEKDQSISTMGWKGMGKMRGRGWRKGRMEKCIEKNCTHLSRSRTHAVIHRLQNHWKKKIVARRLCGECGVRLNGEGAKRIHRERNHRELRWSAKTVRKYGEELCGVKTRPDEIPVLIREKYACEECPYSSPVRSKLDRHQTKHKIKEDFNCQFCSFSCRNNELLQSHQRTHSYRLVDRSEMEGGGGVPTTPTPTLTTEYTVENDSPPALERAESSMGEGEEMGLVEGVGTPPILEMQVEMKEEKKRGRGGRKKDNGKMGDDGVEKRCEEEWRLIEKAVRIRNVGVIGIKRIGGESKRRYKCSFHCPFTAPTISMLWRHARHHVFTSSSGVSLLHCTECTFTTSLAPLLSSHLAMHSRARDTFPCEFCPFVGTSAPSLDDHMESTGHGVPSIPSRHSPIQDATSLQMGSSRGGKAISFNLISSQKWMKPSNEEKKLLKMMNKSKGTRDLQCPECPFSDPSPLIYNLHKKMHQDPKQPFECNVCSYSASTAEGLHHHISLHIPSDTAPLKRGSIRRRPSTESIPPGVSSFDCSSCNFRTIDQAAFHVHKLEHAQLIQQRLVTQIKRAATNGEETRKKYKSAPTTKSMKQLPCPSLKCDFVCETAAALIRHREFHGSKGPFVCHICDYAASTKQITDFHILHHHTKKPLAHLRKQAILMGKTEKMGVSSTLEEKVQLAGQVFVCNLCDSHFLEMRLLLQHWEVDHSRRGDDTACHLSLGMLPTNRVLTKA